jgi:hypothetical protein
MAKQMFLVSAHPKNIQVIKSSKVNACQYHHPNEKKKPSCGGLNEVCSYRVKSYPVHNKIAGQCIPAKSGIKAFDPSPSNLSRFWNQ